MLLAPTAEAITNTFFNAAQTAVVVSSNANAVTLASGDYEFTYSVDGYWAACAGCPATGRFFSVFWPNGIQAQAITAGPLYGKGANITLKRTDGKRFDLRAFTGKLLAYTAGTGAAFEIMPQIAGDDALPDPLMFDASGSSGVSFPHTPNLVGYDTYKFHLFVDWALTALTLVDTNATPPPPESVISADVSPAGSGTVIGAGSYASNSICTLVATPNPAWSFQGWTENGTQVSASASYAFTVSSNRTLVAVFVPLPPVLSIAPVAPGTLMLTWPTNSSGFTLQRTEAISPANWLDATNAVAIVETNNAVILPMQTGSSFFRLRRP